MEEDLSLSSSDYSLAVSIFFIGYLCLQVPSNMILARTKPRLYLPGLMVRVPWFDACAQLMLVCLGLSRNRICRDQ